MQLEEVLLYWSLSYEITLYAHFAQMTWKPYMIEAITFAVLTAVNTSFSYNSSSASTRQ